MPENPVTQPVTPKPTPEYDTWTVEQIGQWAATATDAQRTAAIVYETANQNRPEVLTALGATPGQAPAPPKKS